MSDFDLFAMETLAADASRQVLANPHASAADYRQALGTLLTHFERLVRETRRMISQSDRREAEMNQLNARLGELARRLQYEATHDGLTGVLNRAAITDRAEQLMGAVILLDIDHFKRINDHHGHPCGDATLSSADDLAYWPLANHLVVFCPTRGRASGHSPGWDCCAECCPRRRRSQRDRGTTRLHHHASRVLSTVPSIPG